MPIPAPYKDETKDEFMARCESDSTMNKEYPDNAQRSAICFTSWKDKEKTQAIINETLIAVGRKK